MLGDTHADSTLLLAGDFASFRRQEFISVVINLALLAALLLLQAAFASFWGRPSTALVLVFGTGFAAKAAELIWLSRRTAPLTPVAMGLLTWTSVALNLGLAVALTVLTDKEDSPYFALMVVPVLETAFRFRLASVLAVLGLTSCLNFFLVWFYFRQHPPVYVGEYLEAGVSSLIFWIVAVLVWLLVSQLRRNQARLAHNFHELEKTRGRLLQEERLAAVGRLSSAIAHEIRNPVAMISSSLATATRGNLDPQDREEMFAIAARESNRLVTLTTDFLAYARPRPPLISPNSVNDMLGYVASVCRAHASEKGIMFEISASGELTALMDPGQMQQALLNVVLNAVDASPRGASVSLRAFRNSNQTVYIEVENLGNPIPAPHLVQIFEPFFSTKPDGTGLGLAIARNLARANGGDLVLAANEHDRICFAMSLPACSPRKENGKT